MSVARDKLSDRAAGAIRFTPAEELDESGNVADRPVRTNVTTGRMNLTADAFRRFLAGIASALSERFGIGPGKPKGGEDG